MLPVVAFSSAVVGYLVASFFLNRKEVAYPQELVEKFIAESGLSIEDAVVVVTGSTSGLGLSLATELYRCGATVIVASRNGKKCQSVVEEIRAQQAQSRGQLDSFVLDLVDLDTVQPFVDWFQSKYDHLTFLINNAGIHYGDKIVATGQSIASPQGYDEAFATNFLGHFLLTEKLRPMIKKGRILSMSSSYHYQSDGQNLRLGANGAMPPAADPSIPGMMHRKEAYAITKLAQILHMRYLQRQLEEAGVRDVKCLAACPGWVRTNILPSGPLGFFLRTFAFSPQAGIFSSMRALFDSSLNGGEFVCNNQGPLIGRKDFPWISSVITQWGIRDPFVDLVALVMVVTQYSSYGCNILPGSPESTDVELANELCTWSAAELKRRGYL
eukprot:gene7129-7882_t